MRKKSKVVRVPYDWAKVIEKLKKRHQSKLKRRMYKRLKRMC